MSNPIFSLKKATLGFGDKNLLDGIDLNIYGGDRICLVGKNGEGKSTLFKTIFGEYDIDSGERWILPGTKIGYLPQQFFEEFNSTVEEFLLNSFTSDEIDNKRFLIDIIIIPLQIDKDKFLNELSGGQLRRVYLAKALIQEPDLILLDEPTNHLDITTIEWLENYLVSFKGALICISHDRSFLKNISNKTFWLDSGKLLTLNKGYSHFEEWSIEVYEQRQRELEKLSQKLMQEEEWRHKGVTARRKRNQRRLGELHTLRTRMRSENALQKSRGEKIDYMQSSLFKKSKLIMQIEDISYSINGKKIINNFSMLIPKGEKIGLIGSNGSGKTTLLNLITGIIEPNEGRVKLGKNIDITYYDQKRSELDPNETIWSTLCPSGSDFIQVGNQTMHVVAYLKNFMFDPKILRNRISTLSGGQANRLMLAKVLANPGALLILDEPTNDLDMDTLDMIQEILSEYQGTLIIVSHDRDFLNRIITKSLIFDGVGGIEEFYGSYEEYMECITPKTNVKVTKKIISNKAEDERPQNSKLSYKIQYELKMLPQTIESIENEISEFERELNQPELYIDDKDKFLDLSQKIANKKAELEYLWKRWNELEANT